MYFNIVILMSLFVENWGIRCWSSQAWVWPFANEHLYKRVAEGGPIKIFNGLACLVALLFDSINSAAPQSSAVDALFSSVNLQHIVSETKPTHER